MTKHHSWTEIDNFHTVRKTLQQYPQLLDQGTTIVKYASKVKLHGTNAAVQITSDKKVVAQSRTNNITSQNDNAGFARWVEANAEKFANLALDVATIVIYGEWCGPGIMKGVAVNQIPERIFAIFAIRLAFPDGNDWITTNPDDIIAYEYTCGIPNVHVIEWYNAEFVEIDWASSAEVLQPALDKINNWVEEVEACDPWIEKKFGVKGVGEGLVFYPMPFNGSYKRFSDLCFKAKGEKHKTVAKTKPAQADPTVVANVKAFAEMVVTDARLEQGARNMSGGELIFDMKKMGEFIKWIVNDVNKETEAELEASGLDEKFVNKACSERARDWYLAQVKKM